MKHIPPMTTDSKSKIFAALFLVKPVQLFIASVAMPASATIWDSYIILRFKYPTKWILYIVIFAI